ncbi:hypothetical protein Mal4_21580 [Maioricimonas rarisocia]|uniref:DoxX n=1 Tax=Maioricimonas rarisocia TaxID=2528026 RepID=A0A517Z5Y1_9PLAN|nr:hypothetical protein [Maioricimonas rarisocia]QDU37841.1 hypothetical protein Mal4_21580 [Maioricimonas rarisocia]
MDGGSPYDQPEPRGWSLVQATLRIVVAVQCWGVAATWLQGGNHAAVLQFAMEHNGMAESAAARFDNIIAVAMLACGALTLTRPCWPVLLPVSGWMLLESVMKMLLHDQWLEPAEHASRYLAPVALIVIDFWPPKLKFALGWAMVSMWLLRIAAASTFVGHGLMAIFQSGTGGNFVDLITLSAANVLGATVSEEHARVALAVIGGVDIGVALNLLISRSRGVAFWMAFWGFAAAASRVTAYGPEQYHDILIRVANGGVPAVVGIYWWRAIREQPSSVIPG